MRKIKMLSRKKYLYDKDYRRVKADKGHHFHGSYHMVYRPICLYCHGTDVKLPAQKQCKATCLACGFYWDYRRYPSSAKFYDYVSDRGRRDRFQFEGHEGPGKYNLILVGAGKTAGDLLNRLWDRICELQEQIISLRPETENAIK